MKRWSMMITAVLLASLTGAALTGESRLSKPAPVMPMVVLAQNEEGWSSIVEMDDDDDETSIVRQPSDVAARVGETSVFSVGAEGAGLTYQWYYRKDGASSWTLWQRQTAATLRTTVWASWHKAQVFCLVTGADGSTVRSRAALLTVTPAVTSQPVNVSGTVDSRVTLEVKATGAGLRYQWYYCKDGETAFTKWNGHTGAKTTGVVYASWHNARFYCEITDADGTVLRSDTVKLRVRSAVTSQPQDVQGFVNDRVTLAVRATGAGLRYQWYYRKTGESTFSKWNGHTGATTTGVVYASWHNAAFYCEMTDADGTVLRSDTVKLRVNPRITSQPQDVRGRVNDRVTFSVKATGAGLRYQWYYRKAGDRIFSKWNNHTGATTTGTVYASWHNAEFYCEITDADGAVVQSDTVHMFDVNGKKEESSTP